jgi:predicted O-linked N-acetylglucosamine transferase (SPINDLY family)
VDPWTETLSRAAELAARGELAQAAELHAQRGLWQRQRGQLSEAISSYERALGLWAEQPGVWVNLARARREAGRLEEGLSAFRRALALDPQAATYSMLSNALREAGRAVEALAAARAALALDPEHGEAHLNEGAALCAQREMASAAGSFFVATLFASTRERALHNLRLTLAQPLAAIDDAAPIVRRLLASAGRTTAHPVGAAPYDAAGLLELGQCLARQQRFAAARVCLQQALARQPSAAGLLALAVSCWQGGWQERAEVALLDALELAPGERRAYRLLGSWFGDGQRRPSERCLEQFASCPDDAAALAQLGGAAQRLGRLLLALELNRRLVQLRPEVVESQLYLGTVLTELGEWHQAVQAFERAQALAPERWDVGSSLLFALHLDPELSAEQLFERHRQFGERLAASVPVPLERTERIQRPQIELAQRPLRIGYVSPDLCAHPISYFLEPVLREHDRTSFEPICYSDVRRPDAVTARLAQLAQLVPCRELSHEQLCERIRADGIDVLVDLAGHTAHNRLPVFARRPCPLQVSWLGYFDTTGLAAIDYRITDVHSVPEGAERYFVEKVLRLPRTANCYLPPTASDGARAGDAEAVAARTGPIRFGCFNNPAKIGPEVCRLYARLLHAVPESQLLFKYRSFHDARLRERYRSWFEAEGIAPERLGFAGSSAMAEFLTAIEQLDIALDPFPYSGETTALHTLWRGVPLVTLEGPTPVQRLGSRVLRVAGLDDWVASDEQQYLTIARELASDRTRLAALRRELPLRLAASPLLDHRGFTRELEAAFRSMWRDETLPLAAPRDSTDARPSSPTGAICT